MNFYSPGKVLDGLETGAETYQGLQLNAILPCQSGELEAFDVLSLPTDIANADNGTEKPRPKNGGRKNYPEITNLEQTPAPE